MAHTIKIKIMGQALLEEIQKGTKNATMKRRIVTHFIYNGDATITDLAKDMDLSIPTITKLIDEMCSDGYVDDNGKLETNGGRHPNLYGLNPDAAYFLGVVVSKSYLNFCVVNFRGDVLDYKSHIPFVKENSVECLDRMCSEILAYIDSLPYNKDKYLNVCISLHGRVNPYTGCSFGTFNFAQTPVSEMVSERIGLNVCIDNDSRTTAYGEYMKHSVKCPKNVIFINLSWGLGLAIIIDGKLYNGMSGFAGEFGHNYGYDNQQICHCGKKGCIETEVSCYALYRKFIERLKKGESSVILNEKKIEDITLDDIFDAVAREDVLAIELVEEIGRELGRHIGSLINIFNPEQVIIGGELSIAGDYLLHPVISAIRKYTLNMMYRDSDIILSELKESANAIGSALLARSNVFVI